MEILFLMSRQKNKCKNYFLRSGRSDLESQQTMPYTIKMSKALIG